MRIGIVINTAWNIYNFRSGLIKYLQEQGHEIVAIAPPDEYVERLKTLGVSFIPLEMNAKGTNPVKDLLLMFKMVSVYRNAKLDVVLHYTVKPNIYGTLAAKICGIPTICNVSGLGFLFIEKTIASYIGKKLYWFAFHFPHKIFFQNNDDRQLFVENKLAKATKTEVLPGSGINLETYQPYYKKTGEEFVFLVLARVLYNKGIMEYAEAARQLKTKYPQRKISFNLVGFLEPDPKIGIPETQVKEWQNAGIINYLGHSDNVKIQIADADCMVLPSYREGTSRTLLESIAMAKPIVTTDAPGCRVVVEEGVNGYLCEPKSAESLRDAMDKILQKNEAKLWEMGKNSRRIAEQKFDEKLVFETYYKEIMKHGFDR